MIRSMLIVSSQKNWCLQFAEEGEDDRPEQDLVVKDPCVHV